MVARYLRRGMVAGLLAGLLAGLFAYFSGESAVDGAIRIEEMAAGGGGHEEELVSRSAQKVGLFFATGIFGVTVGGIFGIAFAYFRGQMASENDWNRSLLFASALFVGAFLIPFLKYPANPPTVGDPATIGARTASYLALVLLSLLVVLAAWYAARAFRRRGTGVAVRQLAVGAGFLAAVGVLFLALADAPDPGGFPSGLLWSFRISSLGTQLVFWSGLGAIFGLLCERASRREPLEA